MGILEDKGGFLDPEILTSVGFIILFGLALSATILGYIWGKKNGWVVMPLWQLVVTIGAEFLGAYFFASRG